MIVYNLEQMNWGISKDGHSQNNIAYIDGQNFILGTTEREPSWEADLQQFRVYLGEKYNVTKAYYYVGCKMHGESYRILYKEIKAAGFILKFRKHSQGMLGTKKGNADCDILFDIMKRLYEKPKSFDKIILVSGDGDFYVLVNHLIKKKRLEKILFPKQRYASSLYKSITHEYFDNLSRSETIKRIGKS